MPRLKYKGGSAELEVVGFGLVRRDEIVDLPLPIFESLKLSRDWERPKESVPGKRKSSERWNVNALESED